MEVVAVAEPASNGGELEMGDSVFTVNMHAQEKLRFVHSSRCPSISEVY